MKTSLLLALVLSATALSAAELPPATPSAFDQNPDGWTDLFASGNLDNWSRHRFPATRALAEKSPWTLDPQTKILLCEATNIHEMLLLKTPSPDGTFRVEYRYVGNPPKNNSGIFIRTTPDSKIWIQAQLATSGLGMLFGSMPNPENPEKPTRLNVGARRPELQKPAGEWNILEVSARGTEVTLWINGRQVSTLKNVPKPADGRIGFEAEFWPIEFRNARFKAF